MTSRADTTGVPVMTWGEFKTAAEAQGVTDTDRLSIIEVWGILATNGVSIERTQDRNDAWWVQLRSGPRRTAL